jgi:hypothetical protein
MRADWTLSGFLPTSAARNIVFQDSFAQDSIGGHGYAAVAIMLRDLRLNALVRAEAVVHPGLLNRNERLRHQRLTGVLI